MAFKSSYGNYTTNSEPIIKTVAGTNGIAYISNNGTIDSTLDYTKGVAGTQFLTTVAYNEANYAPKIHTHQISDIINLQFIISNLLPIGTITSFAGNLGTFGTSGLGTGFYSNWALANGANGTYDMRSLFVVGYDPSKAATPTTVPAASLIENYGALGNKGGEMSHVLTSSEMPAHTHTYTDRYFAESASAVTSAGATYNLNTNGHNNNLGSGDTDTDNSRFLYINDTTSSVGSNTAHEKPPYIVLAYIQKIS